MIFKPPHGEHAQRNSMEKILKRPAALGIAHRGNNLRRLVQDDINALMFRPQQFYGNLDVIGRLVRFRAKLRDNLSVRGDEARVDELFRVPPSGDSGSRNNFLQAFLHQLRRIDFISSIYTLLE